MKEKLRPAISVATVLVIAFLLSMVRTPSQIDREPPRESLSQVKDVHPSEFTNRTRCADFSSYQEAQQMFDQYPELAHLDGDGDGIACESLQ